MTRAGAEAARGSTFARTFSSLACERNRKQPNPRSGRKRSLATIITFRCPPLPLDELGLVCDAQTADDVELLAASADRFVVLIGSTVRRSDVTKAIDIAVRHEGHFLRLREGDCEAWIRRLVRTALKYSSAEENE